MEVDGKYNVVNDHPLVHRHDFPENFIFGTGSSAYQVIILFKIYTSIIPFFLLCFEKFCPNSSKFDFNFAIYIYLNLCISLTCFFFSSLKVQHKKVVKALVSGILSAKNILVLSLSLPPSLPPSRVRSIVIHISI